jgi:hypothetical protein
MIQFPARWRCRLLSRTTEIGIFARGEIRAWCAGNLIPPTSAPFYCFIIMWCGVKLINCLAYERGYTNDNIVFYVTAGISGCVSYFNLIPMFNRHVPQGPPMNISDGVSQIDFTLLLVLYLLPCWFLLPTYYVVFAYSFLTRTFAFRECITPFA